MLDERIQVPCNPSNPCILDVKLQCILLASLGVSAMPCVDVQESLDRKRGTTQPFRYLEIDMCTLLAINPWSSLSHEVP